MGEVVTNQQNSRAEDSIFSWQSIDRAVVLPGCSVPIHELLENHTTRYIFAYSKHVEWPSAPLKKHQQRQLAVDLFPVLEAIESLHHCNLYYGRISAKTFCGCYRRGWLRPLIWIDPERASHSDQVIPGHDEEKYWFPDRIRQRRAAAAADDLYALGVVLAELVLQSDRVDRIWTSATDKTDFPGLVRENLHQLKADPHLLAICLWLLDVSRHPNRTAAGAITTLRNSFQRSRYWKPVVATVLGIVAFGVALFYHRDKLSAERDRAAEMSQTIRDLEDEKQIRDERIQELKSELTALRSGTKPSTSERQTVARDRWKSELADGLPVTTLNRVNAWLAEHPQDASNEYFAEWRGVVQSSFGDMSSAEVWAENDESFRSLMKQVLYAPWDVDLQRVQHVQQELNAARDIWIEWAHTTNTFQDLHTQQSLMPTGVRKDALGRWLGQANQLRSVEFIASGGQASQPWSTEHLLTIQIGDASQTVAWNWKNASSAEVSQKVVFKDVSCTGKLNVWLEQDGYLNNTNVIGNTMKSCLWLWWIQEPLRFADRDSGYEISLHVTSSIGPPRRLARASGDVSTDTGDAAASSTAQSSTGKPKYDPAEKLDEAIR